MRDTPIYYYTMSPLHAESHTEPLRVRALECEDTAASALAARGGVTVGVHARDRDCARVYAEGGGLTTGGTRAPCVSKCASNDIAHAHTEWLRACWFEPPLCMR